MTTLDIVAVGLSLLGLAVTAALFTIHRLRRRR